MHNENAGEMVMVDVNVNDSNELAGTLKGLLPVTHFFRFGQRMINLFGARTLIGTSLGMKVDILYDGMFSGDVEEVADTVKLVAAFQPFAFTVNATAGIEAMKVAVANKGQSKVFARLIPDYPFGSAQLAQKAGCDGIIAPVKELAMFRKHPSMDGLIKIVPDFSLYYAAESEQTKATRMSEAIARRGNIFICPTGSEGEMKARISLF